MSTTIIVNVGELSPEAAELIARIMAPLAAPDAVAASLADLAPGLPAVPKAEPTERYAGIAFDENGTPIHHLFLLAAKDDKRRNWKDANDWAEGLGASLPTRSESALLYANLRDQFETGAWYWTSTQFSATYAWNQGFSYGHQYNLGKSSEGLVRAVRRLPI